MTEAEWLACEDPAPMLQFIRTRANDRQLRLISCGFCREKSYWLSEQELRFVDIAEQFADHEIMADDLEMARRAAHHSVNGMNPVANLVCASLENQGAGYEWRWDTVSHQPEHVSLRLALLHDIFGNPFRPVAFSPEWCTDTALSLARQMYESRDFSPMPILADALQDADCNNDDILNHCRQAGEHVRGCWVVDLLLGKR